MAVDKPQPIDADAYVGLNFTGIPERPFDALGLQAHYQRLSAIRANYETQIQTIFARPGRRQSKDGFACKIADRITVAP